jgi:hypothetical protein
MSIFTWALDIACHNAFVVVKQLMPQVKISMREYKRQLVVHLTDPYQVEVNFRKNKISEKLQTRRKKRQDVEGISA